MPLDFIAKPLEQILIAIASATQNYGLSIIIFTILVRLVISPLNLAQLRSARAMAALSPKLKELQKEHGKDREKLTKATMALYSEHKVNPMAGCLPLIIQLPVLWGLFNALNTLAGPCRGAKAGTVALCQANFAKFVGGAHNVHLYHSSFLWLPNLGNPDPFHILPILAGIAQWIQSRMMMQPTTDPQQQQMNQIMQFMPLMIVVFAWNYASGLAVYWVCSTLFSIGLQYFVNRDSLNGPWGQLPILGSGSLPSFLSARFGLGQAPPQPRTVKDAAAAVSRAAPSPRAAKTPPAARPTMLSGRAVAAPRTGGQGQSDAQGPATARDGPRDAGGDVAPGAGNIRPGPRARGTRPQGGKRPGLPAKGVKKQHG